MTLKERLHAELAEAMRTGDRLRRDTLRLLLAAIKQTEVDTQTTLDDTAVAALLGKQAKQRRESISDYKQGGRDDLAGQEERELLIIEGYLPQMMSREEIVATATNVITALGAQDSKDMGRVMGRLMPQLKGQADGRVLSEVVRTLLQSG